MWVLRSRACRRGGRCPGGADDRIVGGNGQVAPRQQRRRGARPATARCPIPVTRRSVTPSRRREGVVTRMDLLSPVSNLRQVLRRAEVPCASQALSLPDLGPPQLPHLLKESHIFGRRSRCPAAAAMSSPSPLRSADREGGAGDRGRRAIGRPPGRAARDPRDLHQDVDEETGKARGVERLLIPAGE
jgi:hypothetical protein